MSGLLHCPAVPIQLGSQYNACNALGATVGNKAVRWPGMNRHAVRIRLAAKIVAGGVP